LTTLKVKRRRYKEWEVIAVLLNQGVKISCPACRRPITDPKNVQREHLHQLGLDGQEVIENCQYWHKTPCSHEKTHGTKATSAGSDAHARAKVRRLSGQTKGRPKRKWPSSKIPSRPFPEVKRPMRGSPVRRT
jgi:hypothetical protein